MDIFLKSKEDCDLVNRYLDGSKIYKNNKGDIEELSKIMDIINEGFKQINNG